jgi:hypothetical protein
MQNAAFNETWGYYPDDKPLHSLALKGDSRAALAPFLAHRFPFHFFFVKLAEKPSKSALERHVVLLIICQCTSLLLWGIVTPEILPTGVASTIKRLLIFRAPSK